MVKTGLKRGETVSASSFTLHKDCNYLFLGKKYELVRMRKMFPRQCACDTYLIFFFLFCIAALHKMWSISVYMKFV